MAILGWRELQALNDERQRGNLADIPDAEWLQGWDRNAPDAQEQFDKRFHDTFIGRKKSADERMSELAELSRADYEPEYTSDDALAAGYGESRFDYRVPFDVWIKDPINYRSNAQSGAGQLLSGIAKIVPYTASTYLDNTLGLIHGLLHVGVDAVDGEDGFKPATSFINNPFSEKMQQLREWSDKVLPNYRTREETEDDRWWNHMNANFWGDTFFKNLGFTIGAGLSGNTFARAFRSGAIMGKTLNKAYKAGLAAADGDKTAELAFQEVLQGGKSMSPVKIYDTFEKTRKAFNRLPIEAQIVGGVGGAIGESRVEALEAAKEFRDSQLFKERSTYERDKALLQQEILSNENYLEDEPVYDGYGNQVGTQKVMSASGRARYEAGLAELQDKYNAAIGVIDNEAERLARNTFWLNMPLLTASNMVMFGRMFSGGFDTQAKIKVKGRAGDYRGVNGIARGIGRGFVNSATEGLEELSQKIISEGQKDISERNMAAFHNGRYDEEGVRSTAQWLASMLDSAGGVVQDRSSWEEFAVGALTGFLGMPHVTRTNGKLKVEPVGGMFGAVKEGIQQGKDSKEYAQKMNERFADPQFKELWEGMVRHQKYENIKDKALEDNDRYAWHGANDAEMLGDVIMFAKTGRLNDLEDFVDSVANIDEGKAEEIKNTLSDPTNPNTDFANMTGAQVADWLKTRATDVKKTINQYRNFYNSIDYLSLGTSDPKVIEELIYDQAQLQNFEDRYNKLVDTAISHILPTIKQVAKEVDATGKPTGHAQLAQHLLETEQDLRGIFGGVAQDIHGRGTDEEASKFAKRAVEVDDKTQASVLALLDQWGAFTDKPEVKKEFEDLQKLTRARQDFYSKLFDPRRRLAKKEKSESGESDFAAAVEEDAVDPNKESEKIMDEARKKTVEESIEKLRKATSLQEYTRIMRNDVPEITDPKTQAMLGEAVLADDKLKGFEEETDKVYNFVDSLKESVAEVKKSVSSPEQIQAYDAVTSALASVSDPADILMNLPEGENPVVAVAKDILAKVSGNNAAEKYTRSILQEKLGDLAQANNLGVIQPNPSDADKNQKKVLVAQKTKKDGSVIEKNFNIKKDDDGFIHAEEAPGPRFPWGKTRAELNALGVTDDDLGKKDWDESKPGEWDNMVEDDNEIRVNKAVLRPDGSLYVELSISGQDTLVLDDGKGANIEQAGDPRKVLLALSPELASGMGISAGGTGAVSGGGAVPGTARGQVSQYKHASDLIGVIGDINDTRLQAVANGDFTDFPGLTEEEKRKLTQEAIGRIEDLKARLGLIALSTGGGRAELGTDEKPETDPSRVQAKQDFVLQETGSLTSKQSIYDTKELRFGRVKQNFGDRAGAGAKATLSWFRKWKVQEFIDSGALAALEDAYQQDGEHLPIFFIANPHYIPDNIENNPFVINRGSAKKKYEKAVEVLYAIELTDKNRDIIKRFINDDSGLCTDDSLITIDGTQYQVIGEMWNPHPDKDIATKKDDATKELYRNVKEEANKVWEYAVAGSINHQYDADVEKATTTPIPKTGKWYVAKIHPKTDTEKTDTHNPDWSTGRRLYSTLNYIMSGRNNTRELGSNTYNKIPLRSSLVEYEQLGGEYHFALRDGSIEGIKYTDGAPGFPKTAISAPLGSLWIATKEANGQYAWNYVTIAQADEYDFDAEENKDTPLMQRFDKAMRAVFGPASDNQTSDEDFARRLAGARELRNLFFFGSGNTTDVYFEDGTPVLLIGGARTYSREDVVNTLKKGKFKFQVDKDALSDPDLMMDLIDSGVLLTEMRSFIRKGATIGVNFLEDRDADGNLVEPYPRNSDYVEVARTPGQDRTMLRTFGFAADTYTNIRIGNVSYHLDDKGNVSYVVAGSRAGDPVTDKEIIASVKALSEVYKGVPADYRGKAWKIERKSTGKNGKTRAMQYTELYEREVDGITVHMVRRGKDGAIELVYNDHEWDNLYELDKKSLLASDYGEKEKEETRADQIAQEKEFDAMRAEEELVDPNLAFTGSRTGSSRHPKQQTVQRAEQDKLKDEESVDC